MKLRISIILSLLAAACGQDARTLPLAGIDMSDEAALADIGDDLGPADRLAFTTYVAVHGRAAGTCGYRLVRRDGRPLETVGDAIDFVRLQTAQAQYARGKT